MEKNWPIRKFIDNFRKTINQWENLQVFSGKIIIIVGNSANKLSERGMEIYFKGYPINYL